MRLELYVIYSTLKPPFLHRMICFILGDI